MVNISKLGDSTIKFTFTDNDRYLYNGEIVLPLNSLILEFDTSDLVIFKKIDGDVFVTFLLGNSNFATKAELESWFKENAVGEVGGGVDSGTVQTMIDSSISGKADTDSLSAYTINEGVASSSQTYDVEVTYDPPVNVYTLDKPYEGILFNLERNYGQRYLIGYDENDTEIGRFYINVQPGNNNTISVDTTGFTDVAIYKTILSSSAATVAIEGNEISAIKKLNFYELYWDTDEETSVYFYNNGYNVTDAFKYDLKKLEGGNSISVEKTASAYIISASVPVSAGTGQHSIIEGYGTQASGHYSHAEGYGTTASGTDSHAEGVLTYAIGQNSHAEGTQTSAMTSCSHAEGDHTIASNYAEHASGHYNISSSGSSSFGDSGNTLFSVGNGVYDNRHNAFEIRQNGDIYFFDGTNDVKLQDVISNILNRLTTIENNS